MVISLTAWRRHWALVLAAFLTLAYLPWLIHKVHRGPFPSSTAIVRQIPSRQRWVALAIADGPSPSASFQLLRILQQNQASATFFVVGLNVSNPQQWKAWAKAARQHGSEIESHGQGHINLALHSYRQDLQDLKEANRAIVRLTGVRPTWLLPPYGALSPAAKRAARRLELRIVLASPNENIYFTDRSWAATTHQVMSHLHPGAIILVHESPNGALLVHKLPQMLRLIRLDGYHIGSLSRLWALR